MARLETFADGADGLVAEAVRLDRLYRGARAREILSVARDRYGDGLALVSSFGAESAVLLHLAAEVDPTIPVLFIDTRKLFPDTLRYRDTLVERFGLTDVRTLGPDRDDLAERDPGGSLWMSDTDTCCDIRKVRPLARGLAGFSAWISGRKRFQASSRSDIPVFESDGLRIKVNPLADWDPSDLRAHVVEHDLPAHPLVAKGYPSIGCMPCTSPVAEGEDPRAGRWRGKDKTECGIHLALPLENEQGAGI
ncbi:MAG: phosphoadenylyl-sulfate reductase [Stappia sp.]|uniref:phosphoadenylyl-sulfate reductase n=1 Tax=Stappia sp. TaxID=1870903 RepID=UPI000C5221A7|nr:phosphoadenylyl-sulfate reductase [Stappia sp.]MAB00207.1 phosphoadenylyl-sulfate reductase [Stappia sp.]MBM21067.1 phosphoadenylyl-sulfate reductase [Stappia sp.]